LFKAVSAVDLTAADDDTKRFVARTLLDFRRAGINQDEATRKRLQALNDQLTSIGLTFDKNIREDVRTVKLDPAQLKGLPADYVKAHPVGPDGKVSITTDYPDYLPFNDYDEDFAARKQLFLEYMNRGWPQNDEPLRTMLALRKEIATTLGYATYADYATEDKMIKTAKNAADFIEQITKAADKRAKRDLAELLKRKKKDDAKASSVDAWESSLYREKVRREQYAFDSQTVRPYFEFAQTRDGLLAVTAKMYGLEYQAVADAAKWHPSVDVYDVLQGGKKLGRIYLDLHPREGKYKHAANFGLVQGVAGVQLTQSVLVCNFADPAKGEALLDHDDVVTMFHEFGHLMHSMLGGQQHWVYFSGTATEIDFVEAPSQMFEEWAWDPAVLATFAKHHVTHEPIPAELVKKMRKANEFGKGSGARQQMVYAALSLKLHQDADPAKLDTTKVVKDVYAKYGMFPHVEGTHLQANFGHLNGYSAMYYSYMWSLVIAKDLLTEFKKHGLMDPATDQKYRDEILARGGSRDAATMVTAFLGRPYDFKAYERWLNEE
jgi:thimet oligopeptidase